MNKFNNANGARSRGDFSAVERSCSASVVTSGNRPDEEGERCKGVGLLHQGMQPRGGRAGHDWTSVEQTLSSCGFASVGEVVRAVMRDTDDDASEWEPDSYKVSLFGREATAYDSRSCACLIALLTRPHVDVRSVLDVAEWYGGGLTVTSPSKPPGDTLPLGVLKLCAKLESWNPMVVSERQVAVFGPRHVAQAVVEEANRWYADKLGTGYSVFSGHYDAVGMRMCVRADPMDGEDDSPEEEGEQGAPCQHRFFRYSEFHYAMVEYCKRRVIAGEKWGADLLLAYYLALEYGQIDKSLFAGAYACTALSEFMRGKSGRGRRAKPRAGVELVGIEPNPGPGPEDDPFVSVLSSSSSGSYLPKPQKASAREAARTITVGGPEQSTTFLKGPKTDAALRAQVAKVTALREKAIEGETWSSSALTGVNLSAQELAAILDPLPEVGSADELKLAVDEFCQWCVHYLDQMEDGTPVTNRCMLDVGISAVKVLTAAYRGPFDRIAPEAVPLLEKKDCDTCDLHEFAIHSMVGALEGTALPQSAERICKDTTKFANANNAKRFRASGRNTGNKDAAPKSLQGEGYMLAAKDAVKKMAGWALARMLRQIADHARLTNAEAMVMLKGCGAVLTHEQAHVVTARIGKTSIIKPKPRRAAICAAAAVAWTLETESFVQLDTRCGATLADLKRELLKLAGDVEANPGPKPSVYVVTDEQAKQLGVKAVSPSDAIDRRLARKEAAASQQPAVVMIGSPAGGPVRPGEIDLRRVDMSEVRQLLAPVVEAQPLASDVAQLVGNAGSVLRENLSGNLGAAPAGGKFTGKSLSAGKFGPGTDISEYVVVSPQGPVDAIARGHDTTYAEADALRRAGRNEEADALIALADKQMAAKAAREILTPGVGPQAALAAAVIGGKYLLGPDAPKGAEAQDALMQAGARALAQEKGWSDEGAALLYHMAKGDLDTYVKANDASKAPGVPSLGDKVYLDRGGNVRSSMVGGEELISKDMLSVNNLERVPEQLVDKGVRAFAKETGLERIPGATSVLEQLASGEDRGKAEAGSDLVGIEANPGPMTTGNSKGDRTGEAMKSDVSVGALLKASAGLATTDDLRALSRVCAAICNAQSDTVTLISPGSDASAALDKRAACAGVRVVSVFDNVTGLSTNQMVPRHEGCARMESVQINGLQTILPDPQPTIITEGSSSTPPKLRVQMIALMSEIYESVQSGNSTDFFSAFRGTSYIGGMLVNVLLQRSLSAQWAIASGEDWGAYLRVKAMSLWSNILPLYHLSRGPTTDCILAQQMCWATDQHAGPAPPVTTGGIVLQNEAVAANSVSYMLVDGDSMSSFWSLQLDGNVTLGGLNYQVVCLGGLPGAGVSGTFQLRQDGWTQSNLVSLAIALMSECGPQFYAQAESSYNAVGVCDIITKTTYSELTWRAWANNPKYAGLDILYVFCAGNMAVGNAYTAIPGVGPVLVSSQAAPVLYPVSAHARNIGAVLTYDILMGAAVEFVTQRGCSEIMASAAMRTMVAATRIYPASFGRLDASGRWFCEGFSASAVAANPQRALDSCVLTACGLPKSGTPWLLFEERVDRSLEQLNWLWGMGLLQKVAGSASCAAVSPVSWGDMEWYTAAVVLGSGLSLGAAVLANKVGACYNYITSNDMYNTYRMMFNRIGQASTRFAEWSSMVMSSAYGIAVQAQNDMMPNTVDSTGWVNITTGGNVVCSWPHTYDQTIVNGAGMDKMALGFLRGTPGTFVLRDDKCSTLVRSSYFAGSVSYGRPITGADVTTARKVAQDPSVDWIDVNHWLQSMRCTSAGGGNQSTLTVISLQPNGVAVSTNEYQPLVTMAAWPNGEVVANFSLTPSYTYSAGTGVWEGPNVGLSRALLPYWFYNMADVANTSVGGFCTVMLHLETTDPVAQAQLVPGSKLPVQVAFRLGSTGGDIGQRVDNFVPPSDVWDDIFGAPTKMKRDESVPATLLQGVPMAGGAKGAEAAGIKAL